MAEKVCVVGTGRMGSLALQIIEQTEGLELHSALNSKSSLDEMAGADTVVDFTRFDVSQEVVKTACQQAECNHRYQRLESASCRGTSGLDRGTIAAAGS